MRLAIRKLTCVGGEEIVLFCIVDDHIHIVLQAERNRAGRLAQAIACSLSPVAASPIGPAYVRPVKDRSHMNWLVNYLLSQPKHHDMIGHPALWSGSCFLDIAGARIVEGMQLQVGKVLPRFRVRTAYEAVGLPPKEISPARDSDVRAAGAARLASAAGAALAVGPPLTGKIDSIVHARRAVVQLAREVAIPNSEVAWALGITKRTAGRLVEPPVEKELMQAIRKRLVLEDLVHRLKSVEFPVMAGRMAEKGVQHGACL